MQFEGMVARLTPDEQRVSGYSECQLVMTMNAERILARVRESALGLWGVDGPDTADFMQEGLQISPSLTARERQAQLIADQDTAYYMIGQLAAYHFEELLKRH